MVVRLGEGDEAACCMLRLMDVVVCAVWWSPAAGWGESDAVQGEHVLYIS